VRIVFFMRHRGSIRNFELLLECLMDRGHEVVLALGDAPTAWLGDSERLSHPLAKRRPALEVRAAPREAGPSVVLSRRLRLALDYLRYLEPTYDDAPRLRERARRRAPLTMRVVTRLPGVRSAAGLRALEAMLMRLERSLPRPKAIERFLAANPPDVVLVTPLVELGSPQTAVVRAARALGIPPVFCVASWDNLTNKGLVREEVDLVTVWNEAQRREAVELHGIPPERVVATGANAYDHWFEWTAANDHEEFCDRVGLPPNRPFVLYVCSSRFIAPDEASVVTRWLRFLRGHSERALRDVGVLIRPHPQNVAQWSSVDLSDLGPVAIHPRGGDDPVDEHSKSLLYDSIHHSAGVVGLNTSALIESAIVGRIVHTLALPEVRDAQVGTLHFHHLVNAGGGVLQVAHTLDEHADQLLACLGSPDRAAERNRAFLEAFVRPYGLDTPASPRLADAIERLAGGDRSTPEPDLSRAAVRLARPA
jgi:hypothetical protein